MNPPGMTEGTTVTPEPGGKKEDEDGADLQAGEGLSIR